MTPPEIPEEMQLNRGQILIVIAVTAVILLIIARLWMYFGQVTLFRFQFTSDILLWGSAFALGISMASALIYELWPQYRDAADYYVKMVVQPLVGFDIVWLGLLPGLSEELLFRGVMLPAFGANWEAVVISSICFGALHLSGWRQWPYVIWASIVGGILGFSALWTGNLLVPIVAHILTNIISAFIWKYRYTRAGS